MPSPARPLPMSCRLPLLLLAPLALAACGGGSRAVEVAPALAVEASAYEAAARVQLAETPALDHEDLHNVFFLSENLISGAEPHSEEALERIAGWGVKTILSVDGKAPLAEAAERLGMRYVHVPIQYRGITEDELLRISKTFREQEGPFYVHCFHGKHRGPAAAAVGRLVLDGAPRDQAIAEMRQWMGTSPSYEGLYRCIAEGAMPTAEQTMAFPWDFTAQVEFEGMRGAMVFAARAHDNLKALQSGGWEVDPTHPDLVPEREAHRLMQIFERSLESDEVQAEGPAFRSMYAALVDDARSLEAALTAFRSGEADQLEPAAALMARIGQTCKACHREHRN
jgi:protein tyrosine phosphatase (PTP) superfamily phosphohydrolase (DUF442 family)